ncbi:carboxymuconolactone decarboxylase family protein [Sphingosinicella sp. LHD-64]|uniref:carboxymuconolactone decarboxylase family protein n=1 Tax=Sphingosinicella sp. LHD-64 TaxID=3072139 RepID=UPI00280CDA7D|nr:carboxymuconolactone decarboxylase family protein [Sphingosinicella sp. LHD-64]MDQ8757494.1 carboxymuconolactone decarboxylase family protein [Sphingosinicella sp. LHD-64]
MSRIAPLERPWPDAFAEAMARTMPPGMEPLMLFRALATSPRAWAKFSAGTLLDKGPLPLRAREIVIDRTTARCGCDYEWGVHVALFAGRAGLTPEQIADTAADASNPDLWDESELALIAAVDALLDRKRLTDDEFAGLRVHFDEDQILETVQLVAFYHGVALICGALDLAPEPGMPTLSEKGD